MSTASGAPIVIDSRQTIRVVHLLNELRPSGAERMLLSAASTWRRYSIDPVIIAMGHTEGTFANDLRMAGYPLIHFRLDRSMKSLAGLRRQLASVSPDAVHIHAERMSFWTCSAALSLQPKPIVVRTIHNIFQFYGALRVRRKYQRNALKRLGTQFVSVSLDVAQNELQRFGMTSHIIENWVDINSFHLPLNTSKSRVRQQLRLPEAGRLLIMVGNCSEAKDHAFAFEVLRNLPSVFQLLHVGEEDTDRKERNLANVLGVSSRVLFLGRRDDVAHLLRACDAFLMPSRWEGFPLAAAEALCAGIPVFLADVEGLRHIGAAYEAAQLLPKDARKWSDGILHLDRLAGAADYESDKALNHFDPDRGVRQYSQAYRKLLKNVRLEPSR